MDDELIKRYQEAISLLTLRNGNLGFYGDYYYNDDSSVSYVLHYIYDGKLKKMKFKSMKNTEDAVKYFIHCAQNMYRLR